MGHFIEVEEIRVRATPGAHIDLCLKAAIRLAADEWRNVRLLHNDTYYVIPITQILDSVKEK